MKKLIEDILFNIICMKGLKKIIICTILYIILIVIMLAIIITIYKVVMGK